MNMSKAEEIPIGKNKVSVNCKINRPGGINEKVYFKAHKRIL